MLIRIDTIITIDFRREKIDQFDQVVFEDTFALQKDIVYGQNST